MGQYLELARRALDRSELGEGPALTPVSLPAPLSAEPTSAADTAREDEELQAAKVNAQEDRKARTEWDDELASWILNLEPRDLPSVPFILRPGETVVNGVTFLSQLQDAVAHGPGHPRAWAGGLQHDMGRMQELVEQQRGPAGMAGMG